MKGIVLAGGHGTRLHPVTRSVNKHLLPIYDKPMIYFPISALMLTGIRDILIISTPEALPAFEKLLGSGGDLGVNFSYAIQAEPRGLAEAFIIGKDFIGDDHCALALGDNIFFGHDFPKQLRAAASQQEGATAFAYRVVDPSRYGVVELSKDGRVLGFEEKPSVPKSSWAITGIYFFDNNVVDFAQEITPSSRGELEIIDILKKYLERRCLQVEYIGRGVAWLDTGTHNTLLQAAQFVETVEQRQDQKIACLEEIAFRMGFIDLPAFAKLVSSNGQGSYGSYLRRIQEEFTE